MSSKVITPLTTSSSPIPNQQTTTSCSSSSTLLSGSPSPPPPPQPNNQLVLDHDPTSMIDFYKLSSSSSSFGGHSHTNGMLDSSTFAGHLASFINGGGDHLTAGFSSSSSSHVNQTNQHQQQQCGLCGKDSMMNGKTLVGCWHSFCHACLNQAIMSGRCQIQTSVNGLGSSIIVCPVCSQVNNKMKYLKKILY